MSATNVTRIRRRRGWPIVLTVTVELLVAALLPGSLAVWLASNRSRDALASEARASLTLLASVTARQLDQILEGATHALVQVCEDDRIASFLARRADATVSAGVSNRLELAERSTPIIVLAMVLDRTGVVLESTNPEITGQDFATRAYFREAIDGRRFTSDLALGRVTRRPSVFISAPVHDGGAIVGVAVLQLDGDLIREVALSASPGGDAKAMLASRTGVILAHTDADLHFHRLGPPPRGREDRVDPVNDHGVDRLPPLPVPRLAAIVRTPRPGADEIDMARHAGAAEPWVVGHAPLVEREWTVAVMVPRRQFLGGLRPVMRQQMTAFLVVAALALLYAVLRARGMVRPLVALTGAAERVAEGDFAVRSGVRRGDEIGSLARAFDRMVPRLREHVELRQSLAVAMDVQQALLPGDVPRIPGLDIAGRSHYCDETGGDYYDYIEVVRDRTLVVLGDVMGHGVASALLMATARAALRAHAALYGDLGELMTRVNRLLSADSRHGRFMTMVVAAIDPASRRIRWASAGHDPIMVFDPAKVSDGSSAMLHELADGELPLGVDPHQLFAEHQATLPPGAVLLLGTDGIWETADESGEMYGKERLAEVIRGAIAEGRDANGIAVAIDDDVTRFRGEARILDDITFVVVRLDGTAAAR